MCCTNNRLIICRVSGTRNKENIKSYSQFLSAIRFEPTIQRVLRALGPRFRTKSGARRAAPVIRWNHWRWQQRCWILKLKIWFCKWYWTREPTSRFQMQIEPMSRFVKCEPIFVVPVLHASLMIRWICVTLDIKDWYLGADDKVTALTLYEYWKDLYNCWELC